MTALFIKSPLVFSTFPAVLVIATMLRLALNLASPRLILANGHQRTNAAGQVIEAFGNFVVTTKGSGRIAEVAARFYLRCHAG